MAFQRGQKILGDRFTLFRDLGSDQHESETWLAVSEDETVHLARLWPYEGDHPPDILRALWDAELRTLYRLSSAPSVEGKLLVIRDAGLDRDRSCFSMILSGRELSDYQPLSEVLQERTSSTWLNVKEPSNRLQLWRSFRRIAEGILLLHSQNIIHRNIRPKFLFLDPDLGPDSLTLGGFEWSIRLGISSSVAPPNSWCTAPEVHEQETTGYSQESDWFSFGMVVARSFVELERYSKNEATKRRSSVIQNIDRVPEKALSALEKKFVFQLIDADPTARITNGLEVLNYIDDIVSGLENQFFNPRQDDPLIVSISPRAFLDYAGDLQEIGYRPSSDNNESFNPNSLIHQQSLLDFIQNQFRTPDQMIRLYAANKSDVYFCDTGSMMLRLRPFEVIDYATAEKKKNYNAMQVWPTDRFPATKDWIDYKQLDVVALEPKVVRKTVKDGKGQSWSKVLPSSVSDNHFSAEIARYHSFVRATNQIELLMKDADIMAYKITKRDLSTPSKISITITEEDRARPPFNLFAKQNSLAENYKEIIASDKPHCTEVILTISDDLKLSKSVSKNNIWFIEDIDTADNTITLSKPLTEGQKFGVSSPLDVPESGYIREWGLEAQLHDIQRRADAVSRLKNHAFLLRSLSSPGQVYMDTGVVELPISISEEEVDSSKQSTMVDILRTRPIYCLEGPPGTGKTTLVAQLLRQIFHEDPVAQVLVTSKSHDAVDVLRTKVDKGIFPEQEAEKNPISLRITGQNPTGAGDRPLGGIDDVAIGVLSKAIDNLEKQPKLDDLQTQWESKLRDVLNDYDNQKFEKFNEFKETVKRGAGITFSTTSSGDLAALANSTQSFDWTIVEEAGKVYPFDLALPLQLGHRWLLIGDNKQLPPFRYYDFCQAVDDLDGVASALREIRGSAGLVDWEWLNEWAQIDDDEKRFFKDFSKSRLFSFKHYFDMAKRAPGVEKVTEHESVGAAAGMLTSQYRMHPTIGNIVSRVFYDGNLEHKTQTLERRENPESGSPEDVWIPKSEILHDICSPEIEGAAIVWMNMQWAQHDYDNHDIGPKQKQPKFTNPAEAIAILRFIEGLKRKEATSRPLELAVISPYVQQVNYLNERFESVSLPSGFKLLPEVKRGVRGQDRLAHTVDSFQGNEADVVIVSLVRNNFDTEVKGLGFLSDSARLNVLLSRPRKLLVLCGSFEYFYRATSSARHQLEEGWHWKQMLHQLRLGFNSGEAVMLDGKNMELVV